MAGQPKKQPVKHNVFSLLKKHVPNITARLEACKALVATTEDQANSATFDLILKSSRALEQVEQSVQQGDKCALVAFKVLDFCGCIVELYQFSIESTKGKRAEADILCDRAVVQIVQSLLVGTDALSKEAEHTLKDFIAGATHDR